MSQEFDKEYWEKHWTGGHSGALPAHPALRTELSGLQPGTALEAGSGEGAEAIWLADHGWDVTAVDISARALARSGERAASKTGHGAVRWVEGDLTAWEPARPFDLITTFYAHPTMPQHAFYERLSHWVASRGTLLIVGHLHGEHQGREHPENAVTEPERIRALLDPATWMVHTAEARERTVTIGDRTTSLHDVVVRAERVAQS